MHDFSGFDYVIPVEQKSNFYYWATATAEGEDTDLDFQDYRINNSGWTFTDPQGY